VDIGLSDLKGLKSNPAIMIGSNQYNVEPDFNHLRLFKNNLIVQPDLSAQKSSALDFSFELDLRGSSDLTFLHLGKTTTVRLEGRWKNPSFTGRYLPDDRQIAGQSFAATWKLPYFTRPFPQQWTDENTKLEAADESSFGVKFILPVDQYQKTMRTAKYAILLIILSFISLFFTEILSKRSVHLLQYILIGAAMIIYYTLLLSLSEQVGFNAAYLIASVVTIGLIGTFIAALLRNKKPALLFSGILTIFYGFVFVIIQLQDLALLFGSIGLFIVTACLMYLSARISRNPV
jgi:inner membrane protein